MIPALGGKRVELNVYDLQDANSFSASAGVGIYHTGVMIDNWEYSFSQGGIFKTRPRLPEFGNFKEFIFMGEHDMSQGEINEILTSFRADKFAVGRYHLMTNNCNHFSDAFIFALLGVHIPAWVNRAANIGAAIIPSGLIPSDNAPVAPTSTTDLSTKALPPSSSLPQLGEISRSRSGVKDVVSVPASASTEEKGASVQGSGFLSSIFGFFSSSQTDTTNTTKSAPVLETSTSNKTSKSSKQKKELTEKQKEALAKLKTKS